MVTATLVAAALVAAGAAPAIGSGEARPDGPERVSVETISLSRSGEPTGQVSLGGARMSDDGRRVVFSARSNRLMPGRVCVNTHCVYLRDRVSGRLSVVSSTSDGTPDGDRYASIRPAISGDGQFVAFAADAAGLAPGPHPGMRLYMKNLRTGELEATLTPPAPGPGHQRARATVRGISERGRFVAVSGSFRTGDPDVSYVYDRATGDWQPFAGPYAATSVEAMSDNADYVAYESWGGGNGVFVFERRTGRTRQVPTGPADPEAYARVATFSGDGRLLMVTWQHYDWDTGLTDYDLVVYRSHDLNVVEVIEDSRLVALDAASTTGRYVVGSSRGASYGTEHGQTIRLDRRTGQIKLITVSPSGEPADAWSHGTDISANGKTILFNTPASNIAPEGDQPYEEGFEMKYDDLFVATLSPLR